MEIMRERFVTAASAASRIRAGLPTARPRRPPPRRPPHRPLRSELNAVCPPPPPNPPPDRRRPPQQRGAGGTRPAPIHRHHRRGRGPRGHPRGGGGRLRRAPGRGGHRGAAPRLHRGASYAVPRPSPPAARRRRSARRPRSGASSTPRACCRRRRATAPPPRRPPGSAWWHTSAPEGRRRRRRRSTFRGPASPPPVRGCRPRWTGPWRGNGPAGATSAVPRVPWRGTSRWSGGAWGGTGRRPSTTFWRRRGGCWRVRCRPAPGRGGRGDRRGDGGRVRRDRGGAVPPVVAGGGRRATDVHGGPVARGDARKKDVGCCAGGAGRGRRRGRRCREISINM